MTSENNIYYPNQESVSTLIKCIWRLREYDLKEQKEIIIPKGNVEIIFNYSNKVRYINSCFGQDLELPSVFINGINTKPLQLIKNGYHEFLGIQLTTIGLKLLSNAPVNKFNDCVIEGTDLCKSLTDLSEELYHAISFNNQVNIILNWFKSNVYFQQGNYAFKRAQHLMNLVHNKQLLDTIKENCSVVGLSQRQLSRFSNAWFGMNTESFIKYNKYLDSLSRLHHSTKTLTEIALESGYYDQSHFIRNFKSYTGLTPKQYQKVTKQRQPGHIFP